METLDLDALTTAELYSELCNIVERGCRGLPLPGDDGDDGDRLTSEHAGAVTYAANPTGKNDATGFQGITTYSSADLANWKLETISKPANTGGWFGRVRPGPNRPRAG